MWKRVLRRVLPGFAALPTLCAILILGLRSLGHRESRKRAFAMIEAMHGAIDCRLTLPGAHPAPASAQR